MLSGCFQDAWKDAWEDAWEDGFEGCLRMLGMQRVL